MSLDLRTIAALTSLSALLVGLAMLAAAASVTDHSRGIRRWAAASLTLSLAWALLAQTGRLPVFLCSVAANSLLVAARALYLHSLREFVGCRDGPLARAAPYSLVLPVFALFLYYTDVAPSLAGCIVVVSVAAAALELACAATLLWRRGRWPFSRWLTGLGFLIGGAGNLLRGAFVLAQGYTAPDLLARDGHQAATFLLAYGTVFVFAFGFALMCGEAAIADLRRAALSDALTGSLNRSGIEAQAQREMKRAVRARFPLSLLLLDVDNFKSVNDAHGHLVGDEVLRGLVRGVEEQLRAYDLIGRFGGEEFLVVLPSTGAEDALRIAERIRGAVEASPVSTTQEALRCTVSVGVATLGSGGEDLTALLGRADAALYAAKAAGRNRVAATLAG